MVRLPFNLGIGGAMQTGYQYAQDRGFDLAIQVDGDGQHDPREIALLIEPILGGQADMAVGTRFAGERRYRPPFARRIGIQLFARVVSLIVRQRVTDTTSGFRAVNKKGIALFAADYPHDYPEVETTVLVHQHRLRMVEVPVAMRTRAGGRSSITFFQSIYYMLKVSIALFVRALSSPFANPGGTMTVRVSVFAALAALVLLAVIFELIRSRRLHERYAIMWLLTGGVILVLAVWRDALGTLADMVGIAYPPSALFVLASLFILVVLLHYSTVISKLADQNRILAQRLALLEGKVRDGEDGAAER